MSRNLLVHKTHLNSAGFSLMEVLVSLVVLSIGLLGAAMLQGKALNSNTQSFLREKAVVLAHDMEDRMRANRIATVAGNYNSADTTNYEQAANNSCTEVAGTSAANCSAQQLAAHDTFEWGIALAQALPSGTGTVCADNNPSDANACDGAGTVYSITVTWTEMQSGVAATASYRLRTAP